MENGKIFGIKAGITVLFGTWLPLKGGSGQQADLLPERCDTAVSREAGGLLYRSYHIKFNLIPPFPRLTHIKIT